MYNFRYITRLDQTRKKKQINKMKINNVNIIVFLLLFKHNLFIFCRLYCTLYLSVAFSGEIKHDLATEHEKS